MIAGHTTGGRRNSDEITAVPLKERHGCHGCGRNRAHERSIRKRRRRGEQRNDRHHQRLQFALGIGRQTGGRDRGGRSSRRHAANSRRAMRQLAAYLAAALLHHGSGDATGCRKHALPGENKPEHESDCRFYRTRCHGLHLAVFKAESCDTLPEDSPIGKRIFLGILSRGRFQPPPCFRFHPLYAAGSDIPQLADHRSPDLPAPPEAAYGRNVPFTLPRRAWPITQRVSRISVTSSGFARLKCFATSAAVISCVGIHSDIVVPEGWFSIASRYSDFKYSTRSAFSASVSASEKVPL